MKGLVMRFARISLSVLSSPVVISCSSDATGIQNEESHKSDVRVFAPTEPWFDGGTTFGSGGKSESTSIATLSSDTASISGS
jgi:hypothetical protein